MFGYGFGVKFDENLSNVSEKLLRGQRGPELAGEIAQKLLILERKLFGRFSHQLSTKAPPEDISHLFSRTAFNRIEFDFKDLGRGDAPIHAISWVGRERDGSDTSVVQRC